MCWDREMPEYDAEDDELEEHEPLYEYLVAWNGKRLFSRVEGNSVTVGPKIDSGHKLRALEKVMERQTGLRSIVVTNIVLLREVPADE